MIMLGTEIETVDNEPYQTKQFYESHFWYVRDSEMHWAHVTPDHRFYDHEGYPKQAQDFEVGDLIRHRTGDFEVTAVGRRDTVHTKVQVIMPRIHLFWANGFLSHTP